MPGMRTIRPIYDVVGWEWLVWVPPLSFLYAAIQQSGYVVATVAIEVWALRCRLWWNPRGPHPLDHIGMTGIGQLAAMHAG